MPIFVLTLRPFGLLVQVRGTMMGALASPCEDGARKRREAPTRIIFRHALRNSLLPRHHGRRDLAGSLVNGAVVVESIFGWPGIGKLMIDAIVRRDFALIQLRCCDGDCNLRPEHCDRPALCPARSRIRFETTDEHDGHDNLRRSPETKVPRFQLLSLSAGIGWRLPR